MVGCIQSVDWIGGLDYRINLFTFICDDVQSTVGKSKTNIALVTAIEGNALAALGLWPSFPF